MHSLVSRGCVPKSSEDLSGLVHLPPGLGPFSLPSPSGTPQGEDGPPSFGFPALSPPRTGALHRPTSDRIPRLPKGRRLHLHAPLPKIFGRSGHLPTPPRFLPRTSSHSGMTRSTFPSHNFCFTSSTQQSASSPNASLPKAHRCSPAGYPSTTRTRSGQDIWANPSLQVAPSPMTTAAPPVSPSPPPLQRHRGLHHRYPHAGLPPLNPLLSLPQPASPMLLRPLKQPLCRTSPLGPDCLFLCLPHRSPPTPILPPRQIWDTPASSSQPLPLASRAQLGQGESLSPSCRDRGRMLGFHPQSSRGGWAIGCSSRQA
jgi:hypothetical protein